MNTLISTKELRASLPKLVRQVQRGARFTVLYRSRPVFQIVPTDAGVATTSDLDADSLYRAPALGRSKGGRRAADHDAVLYRG
jgi:antitoxin (DNA-binding transcriptional repressor) of toxin-antitoxin stability system